MRSDELLERARAELAAGKASAALRSAWEVVNRAMAAADDQPLPGALEIAEAIASASDGRLHAEAERLARYCRAVLDGVGGGAAAPSALDRLFSLGKRSGRDRRRCPECAESIMVDARICRHCGHRLALPS